MPPIITLGLLEHCQERFLHNCILLKQFGMFGNWMLVGWSDVACAVLEITLENPQRDRWPLHKRPRPALLSSSTVVKTNAGWPTEAAQASSSMFTPGAGMTVSNSRRALSGEISSTRSERPIPRPIVPP